MDERNNLEHCVVTAVLRALRRGPFCRFLCKRRHGEYQAMATYRVNFDGSARPNPGPGGWGAVISERGASGWTKVGEAKARLGDCTSNAAEYAGLIGGVRALRRVLRKARVSPRDVCLEIAGDSELVIGHMTHRMKVRSANLKTWNAVARGVVQDFGTVSYIAVPRAENTAADALASAAQSKEGFGEGGCCVYYPSLMSCSEIWLGDRHFHGSQDVMTAGEDPSCFIDAAFLASVKGIDSLKNLKSPGLLSAVNAKVNMSVLGVTSLDIGVIFVPKSDTLSTTRVPSVKVDVVVVDKFPVPMHVSHRNAALAGIPFNGVSREDEAAGRVESYSLGGGAAKEFKATSFPEEYRTHPYWTSEVIFFAPSLVFPPYGSAGTRRSTGIDSMDLDIVSWEELWEYGGNPAEGMVLEVRIMTMPTPGRNQCYCTDHEDEQRLVAFYLYHNEPPTDLQIGKVMRWKNPRFHGFMDGRMGARIDDDDLPNISFHDEFANGETLPEPLVYEMMG